MSDQPTAGSCPWCGEAHGARCPWVKAFEFSPANPLTITRVEFLTPADYGIRAAKVGDSTIEEPADYPKLKPMGG